MDVQLCPDVRDATTTLPCDVVEPVIPSAEEPRIELSSPITLHRNSAQTTRIENNNTQIIFYRVQALRCDADACANQEIFQFTFALNSTRLEIKTFTLYLPWGKQLDIIKIDDQGLKAVINEHPVQRSVDDLSNMIVRLWPVSSGSPVLPEAIVIQEDALGDLSIEPFEGAADVVVTHAPRTRSAEEETLFQKQRTFWGLVGANNHKAAERLYQDLVSQGGTLEMKTYAMAANVAQARGDYLEAYKRAKLAVACDPESDEINPKKDYRVMARALVTFIEENLCGVRIELRRAVLAPNTMPFNPSLKAAIEFAQEQLSENGVFEGLLPILDEGNYYTLAKGERELVRFKTRRSISSGSEITFLTPEALVVASDVVSTSNVTPTPVPATPAPSTNRNLSLWGSALAVYSSLNPSDDSKLRGLMLLGDITARYQLWNLPLSARFGICSGWSKNQSGEEKISSIPLRETVGVDLSINPLHFSLGPSLAFQQHFGTSGSLLAGTGNFEMSDPEFQPLALTYGGQVSLGWERLQFIAAYMRGLTQIRGPVVQQGNELTTTGLTTYQGATGGFRYRFF